VNAGQLIIIAGAVQANYKLLESPVQAKSRWKQSVAEGPLQPNFEPKVGQFMPYEAVLRVGNGI
jgi:hypothetical protein